MTVATKLAGFTALLLAVFAGALWVGRVVGPVSGPIEVAHTDMTADTGEHESATFPKGLLVAQDGYALRLADPTAKAGTDVPVSFTIEGAEGDAVTKFDVEHDKRMHLIAVRRDLTGFQHVHPELGGDGTWSTDLDLTPGSWRLFADFKPTDAEPLTLGADLSVGGDYQPAPGRTAQVRTATVDDYTVTLDGDLTVGHNAELTFTVTRGGEPVRDLEPYLGAYGHLVALREGDLAYLHVHPEDAPGDGATEPGPEVAFYAEVPSAGRYHLYLNFKHDGVVRTAVFTVPDAGGDMDDN